MNDRIVAAVLLGLLAVVIVCLLVLLFTTHSA